jgi:hypothetical protein
MTTQTKLRKRDLYIDQRQGSLDDGRDFGYVAVRNAGDEVQSYFFAWPGRVGLLRSARDRDAMIASLEPEEAYSGTECVVPRRWAEAVLAAYLRGVRVSR